MNVMVIAPHPDDEAIGCGGTLCLHSTRGDRVAAVFLTSGELALKHLPRDKAWRLREAEAERAAAILGIAALTFLRCPDWGVADDVEAAAAALRPVLERESPDRIYLPHPGDQHPDHRAALPVLRMTGIRSAELLGYEVWTPLAESEQVEDITTTMARKLRAVRCHRSQLSHFRYDRAIAGLNRYRGILAARCRYAEVFQPLPPVSGASAA